MSYKVSTFEKLEDVNFEKAEIANIDKVMWVNTGNNPKSFAQMVFVKGYGFLIKMTTFEVNPTRTHFNDNDPICDDSVLEAFLMFDNERYLNLECNANGARKQALRRSREIREHIYNNEFNGFEEIPTIEKDSWNVLLKMPIEKIVKLYPSLKAEDFKKGFRFTGNFYKVHELKGSPLEHYIAYKEIKWPHPDFHRPEQFAEFIID